MSGLCRATAGLAALSLLAGCGVGDDDGRRREPRSQPERAAREVRGVRVVAAGDIACDPDSPRFNRGRGVTGACQHAATARRVRRLDPRLVFALGDIQYPGGGYRAFLRSFDRAWGRLRDRIRPVPGNHEYGTPGAAGYFRYFGAAAGEPGRGWYSFDVAGWHVVALDSNCSRIGGCGRGTAQLRWLAEDLAASDARCTIALMHHPRFSSGIHGDDTSVTPIWRLLVRHGVEMVLSGHDHDYERFLPQTASGERSGRGVRQFVVGTGGDSLYPILVPDENSAVSVIGRFGVLELTLGRGEFAWRFVQVNRRTKDHGSARCH